MNPIISFLKRYKTQIPFGLGIITATILFIYNSSELPFLIGLILVVFIPYSKDLIEFILNKYHHRLKLVEIKQVFANLDFFYTKFLNSNYLRSDYNSLVSSIDNSYEYVDILKIGKDLIHKTYDNDVLIIYLCFIIDYNISSNEQKIEARQLLNSILENNSINSIDSLKESQVKNLLLFYSNYRTKNILSLNQINLNNKELFEEFIKNYATSIHANYILNLDIKKSKEYQRTLSKLIDQGKIHAKNIAEDLDLKKNLNTYLLLSNRLEKNNVNIKNKLNEYNQIDFNGSSGEYNYKSRIVFLNKKTEPEIFLQENYEQFFEKNEKIPGFVGLFPIEIDKLLLFPKEEIEIIDKENYLRRNYQKLVEYQLLAKANNEKHQLIMNNIPIKDILSNIPINIFIPNEKEIIKNFIIDSYPVLKKHFEIKTIYDWSEINIDDLKNYILTIDNEKLLDEDKWLKISTTIIDEAVKIRNAIS